MAKVLGIGGIFFKSSDKSKLQDWYCEHMKLPKDSYGYVNFPWRHDQNTDERAMTVWSPFAEDSDYFEPTQVPYMINYIVDDLDGMLAQLREAGATVDDKIQDESYGRFGWATDPEGVRFELWQPKGELPE